MEQDRIRRDNHSSAGASDSPAEVDVIAKQRKTRLEAAERGEDVTSYQHACRADREHLTDPVMLTLVVLSQLQTSFAVAGAGDAHSHLEEPPSARPGPDPAADHRDRRIGGSDLAQAFQCLGTG